MKILQGLADGQVLQRLGQRGATAFLTGNCNSEGPVLATIRRGRSALKGWTKRRVGHARSGTFTAQLRDIAPGGPYQLELRVKKETIRIRAFYVGDVWLLAGQSNMEGVGYLPGGARPHPLIQCFSLRRVWRRAEEPLHLLAESPDSCHNPGPCTPEEGETMRRTATRGVGPGLFFAREMLRRTSVPQGLICTAHGGTSMTQWEPGRRTGGTSFYGSMFLSFEATGQPVAGVLWYQGEADTNPENAPFYTNRMKRLVRAVRRDLHQPTLPWLTVQLGRFCAPPAAHQASWNQIREAQRRLPDHVQRLEVVAAIDLPLDDAIHISTDGYPRLANRLARAADRLVHANRNEQPAPRLRSVSPLHQRKGDRFWTIDVAFDNIAGNLQSSGEPSGFTLLDAIGAPLQAIYKITFHGNIARLHLPWIPEGPVQLFYGHGTNPICNLTDQRDMAMPVFGPLPIRSAIK